MRAATPALRTLFAATAALVAGCASTPLPPWNPSVPVPAPTPAPVTIIPLPGNPAPGPVLPPPPPPPPPDPEDEAFGGLRFGATRAEILLAYPNADCGGEQCVGAFNFSNMPATFVIFSQPDGRWVASVAVNDATPAAKAWQQANAVVRERWLSPNDGVEQGGALLRWRVDREGTRQAVLRRCAPDSKCRGAPRTVVEIDYLAKGAPLAQPW